ncbi:nucleotidyltransferase family protein [Candidatus Magnetominusculus xianensis]|uniref:Nucleotidyltransferase n=1 Tax=Candidatus Magnetominusculus xianensis TaxID=1748249 RepID=A0ABR5SF05_9BACT|nr:nucleotidyltransferase domain-containing protein [Candidatus Magnetominusculus xianensis]KWT83993.1 nucleotidyltransferase [Candidatus Magnetominusculus xianensis]MBF0405370.1 nucleotidyltransferase domain-containing protein [Nitrospirota bacterium]
MINEEISRKLDKIKELFKDNKVEKAYIFGSACTDNFNETSDVDILITIDETLDISEYGNCFWNVQFGLEGLLQREIDLITERSIKNPYLMIEINKMKIAIL